MRLSDQLQEDIGMTDVPGRRDVPPLFRLGPMPGWSAEPGGFAVPDQ